MSSIDNLLLFIVYDFIVASIFGHNIFGTTHPPCFYLDSYNKLAIIPMSHVFVANVVLLNWRNWVSYRTHQGVSVLWTGVDNSPGNSGSSAGREGVDKGRAVLSRASYPDRVRSAECSLVLGIPYTAGVVVDGILKAVFVGMPWRIQDGSLSTDPLGDERHPPTGISASSYIILTLFILQF